jgi:hypothetical protein
MTEKKGLNMKYNVNGLEITTSDVGRSGYHGVTFSPAWTLDENYPFIAMTSNPVNDPVLSKWLTARERTSLHLGHYSDAREAAYVYAIYKDEPEEVLKQFYHGTFNPDFPKELYDLPVFLKLEDAQEEIRKVKTVKKVKRLDKNQVYQIARENIKVKDMKILTVIRKKLDIGIMNRQYNNENDVIDHVNKIMKEI